MASFDSVAIAKYIISRCDVAKIPWNKTKIQKLLYICHGVCLAVNNSRLLKEGVYFMPHGPVSLRCLEEMMRDERLSSYKCNVLEIPQNIRQMIDVVVERFGRKSSKELGDWSHKSGSPWDRARLETGCTYGSVINDEYIKDYFYFSN